MIRLEYVDRRAWDLYRTYDLDPECEYLRAIDLILYLYHINDDGTAQIYDLAEVKYRNRGLERGMSILNSGCLSYDDSCIITIGKNFYIKEKVPKGYLPELISIELERERENIFNDYHFGM